MSNFNAAIQFAHQRWRYRDNQAHVTALVTVERAVVDRETTAQRAVEKPGIRACT
ncbi:MAG: hypothetical protein ACR2NZ_05535 [Rubripirellula sp.]